MVGLSLKYVHPGTYNKSEELDQNNQGPASEHPDLHQVIRDLHQAIQVLNPANQTWILLPKGIQNQIMCKKNSAKRDT